MARCLMPWYGLSLSPRGDVKPCCLSEELKENIYSNDFDSVKKSYSSSEGFRELRRKFLKDIKPSKCKACWEREKFIEYSRRIWFDEKFSEYINPSNLSEIVDDPQWVQMDINLSNQCNLKCRMCGVWASHQWVGDEKALGEVEGNPFKRETRDSYLQLLEADMEVIEGLIPNMKKVRRIDFKGGEPFLARNHHFFLKKLIESGINEKVILHYTTNGTVVNKKVLTLLSQFKRVNISFSIEATGPLYSYIRGGDYSTKDLYENLKRFDELGNIHLCANVAMQAYNLLNLRSLHEELNALDLKSFSAKNSFQCIVNWPDYLSPFVWPQKIRDVAIQQLSGIEYFEPLTKSLASQKYSDNLFKKFLDFTERLDKIRNENFWSVVPELKSMVL